MQDSRIARPQLRQPSWQACAAVLLIGLSSAASASTTGPKDCDLTAQRLVAEPVDYSSVKENDEASLKALRDDVRKLDSLVLTKSMDTRVARKLPTDMEDSMLADKSVSNAAEQLAEKRLLERKNGDAPSDVKTTLPGVDAAKLKAFQKQMYRTDI